MSRTATVGLSHLEAPVRGEWRLPDDLRQVLVEKHARDELLTRSDAELLEQALGVVLDSVGGEKRPRRFPGS